MASKKCTDHLGNEYPSESEKCRAYNIKLVTYRNRKSKGWTEEEALTKSIKITTGKIPCTDHLGNEYPSISAKCKAYNINTCIYNMRKRVGWNEKEALTTPKITERTGVICTDHLGNEYLSIRAKCKAYNITEKVYSGRISRNWTEEEALTTPYHKHDIETFIDPIYNDKLTIRELSLRYNKDRNVIRNQLNSGFSMIQIIGISIIINIRHNKIHKTVYNLYIDKRIKKGKNVFECYIINNDGSETFKIMSQEMIDQYCLEQYKKEKGLVV